MRLLCFDLCSSFIATIIDNCIHSFSIFNLLYHSFLHFSTIHPNLLQTTLMFAIQPVVHLFCILELQLLNFILNFTSPLKYFTSEMKFHF